jgi:hypothetical protein
MEESMRRIGAIGLIGLLSVNPLLADGPLARSIDLEAARLAALPPAQDREEAGWSAVRRMDPGTTVLVTTTGALLEGRLVSVDAAAISVDRSGGVQRVRREDVIMVERHIRRGSALAAGLAVAGGLWLGSVLAVGMAFDVRCQPHCGGVETAMFAAVVGTPIAAGYGAWRATSHIADEVLYRRAPQTP